MLSILIPSYNSDCVVLVDELVSQVENLGVGAEIVVVDDGSTNLGIVAENASIERSPICRYVVSPMNVGIARTRNKLLDMAKGDYLLFLDADTFPACGDFVKLYMENAGRADVVVGGMRYRRGSDTAVCPLRLRYGAAREAKTARSRSRLPYEAFISCNFLISRRVAEQVRFDETFDRYGHEDTIFGTDLQNAGFSVLHIDNPVFHDPTDTSEQYLSKVRVAIQSLSMHADRLDGHSSLLSLYNRIDALGLTALFRSFFRVFRGRMESNLLGARPSLFVLDLYRLSYLCSVLKL